MIARLKRWWYCKDTLDAAEFRLLKAQIAKADTERELNMIYKTWDISKKDVYNLLDEEQK